MDYNFEKNIATIGKISIFMLNPILGFLSALKNINTRSSFLIFFLFCAYFGIMFQGGYIANIDADYYQNIFVNIQSWSWQIYLRELRSYLTFGGHHKDFGLQTFAFLCSRLSENIHIFWMFSAMIFSYIYLKCLRFVSPLIDDNNLIISYLLLLVFTFSNSIFNINGMRFWICAWICVFAIFKIFTLGDKRFVALLFVTPFIHSSYFIFLGVFFVISLLKKHEKMWLYLLIFSFLLSNISLDIFIYFSNYMPAFFANIIAVYTDSEYVNLIYSGLENSRFMVFFRPLQNLYINLWILVIYRLSLSENTRNNDAKPLVIFSMAYLCFVNFFMPIPSLGERYIDLIIPWLVYLSFVYFPRKTSYNIFVFMFLCVNALDIYIWYVRMSMVTDHSFLYSNYISQLINNLST